MKCSIIATGLLALSTATALTLPKSTRSTTTTDPKINAVANQDPIPKAEFAYLYDIVQNLVKADDIVGLEALQFLAAEALEDYASPEASAPETSETETQGGLERRAGRTLSQSFDRFRNSFRGSP